MFFCSCLYILLTDGIVIHCTFIAILLFLYLEYYFITICVIFNYIYPHYMPTCYDSLETGIMFKAK